MADNNPLNMTNLVTEESGHPSSQEASGQSVASFVISKKTISEPAAGKLPAAPKTADGGNEESESDGETTEMNRSRDKSPTARPSNRRLACATTRYNNWKLNLALKVFKMVVMLLTTVGVFAIVYKMWHNFDRLSIVIGPTAATADSAGKSLQQTGQLHERVKAQSMESARKATPTRNSLVKLALDQNSLPVCSADEKFSTCKLSTKSWVRLSRTNPLLAPLKYLSASVSHGTKDDSRTENSFLRLNKDRIVISQSGEYTFRVQIVARCTESKNTANSISMKLMVNEITEVQYPTACSGGNSAFRIPSAYI